MRSIDIENLCNLSDEEIIEKFIDDENPIVRVLVNRLKTNFDERQMLSNKFSHLYKECLDNIENVLTNLFKLKIEIEGQRR